MDDKTNNSLRAQEGKAMTGIDVFQILMQKNGVDISAEQSIRLANFISGMISAHDHVKKDRDEALAKLAAMEGQEPVAWVTSRPDICYFTTGRESAERWRKGGWTVDPLYAKPVPADKPAARPTDDDLWDQTITERDTYHDWADKLANAISGYFGSDIGEHTSANNPWEEALEVIECADNPAGRITEQDAHDKNSQRYLWIKENIQEEPTQGSLNDSEYAEHKTRYKLPLLISWADFCGRISLDDAIDNQISRGDRCPCHERGGKEL